MSTTALIAEILVCGILVLTWTVLALLGFPQSQSIASFLANNQIAGGAVFLAYSYAVGVVFDRIWDIATKPIDHRVRKDLKLDAETLSQARKSAFGNGQNTPAYFEYIRSRMRIARCCLCNAPLIALSAIFLHYRNTTQPKIYIITAIASTGLIFTSFSFVAFKKLLRTYYKQLLSLNPPEKLEDPPKAKTLPLKSSSNPGTEPSKTVTYQTGISPKEAETVSLYSKCGWSSAEKPKQLLNALSESHRIVTARVDSKLVGLGNAISDGHLVVYYPHLVVDPDYQGKGIGSEIMRQLQEPYKDFHQQMLTADKSAIAFYKKLGYKRAGSTEPMWIYQGDEH